MPPPFPLGPSLWAATAPPAPPTPPLAESVTTDVCVIGGGYCGLSAALHLAEAGISVRVLEAEEPGWGGSGRNGGQVIPGLKYDPDELEEKFPGEAGARLVAFAGGTADTVFDLIAKHRMDVPHTRAGWVQGAHSAEAMAEATRRAEQWARRGVAARVLDTAQTASLLGTGKYVGGWLDPRGGAVQPLAYARGLARAAQTAGAIVHGRTGATSLTRRNGRWEVSTASGASVTAEQVVVATNGYSGDLIPNLRRSVIAMNSFIVATEPLSDNLRHTVLPQGHVSSDTRKLLLYFRLDHEGRLLMGGRGPLREPKDEADWAHLERVTAKMFPQVGSARIAYRWCGRVALTRDFLPHLHMPAPGLLVDIGCMGRGVGLQTAMGRAIARYLRSSDPAELPLPPTPIAAIPLHGARRLYVSAIIAWYKMNDAGIG